MAGKLLGAMCALRMCVSCGERTWVLDSDGTCPDCGGRSRPAITQLEIAMDEQSAARANAVIAPLTIESAEQCAQFFAALEDVKKKVARYRAFEKFGVNALEYNAVRVAYDALDCLLGAKLMAWYARG